MASDNDKKGRRRSFFSFGSGSLDKVNPTVDMASSKTHTSKNERSKRPLEMQPLKNRNPFIEEVEHNGDKEVPKASSEAPTGPDIKALRRKSTNPFLVDENIANIPKAAPRTRRPPPPIDMDAVKIFAHTAPLDITTSASTAQVSSTDETLKSASVSPRRTPVPPVDNRLNQHRRQRSEAEKLVDDLDDYIKQHEERIQSHSPKEGDNEGYVSANMDSEVSLESPFMSVDPLSIVASDRESRLGSHGARKSDLGSELDTDAFSFTDSLNGKSVNSIQQVAMSEVNGAAPILVKLGYTNSNAMQSDSNENYESANQEARHNQPKTENIQRVTSHDESPKAEQDQFNDNDNDSYGSQSEIQEPRRTFRVVNEDRPHFYFQTAGDTTTSTNASSTTEDDASESNRESITQNENNDRLSVTSNLSYKYPQDSSGEDGHSSRERSSLNKFMGTNSPNTSVDYNKVGSLLEGGALKIEKAGDAPTVLDTPPVLDTSTVLRSPSIRSSDSATTTTSGSSRPDKTVRLVSSYVEELRLKYYKTSNFLAAPPNLPVTLKQKNNLIQPKNIKVRIRTSSKQIGIKHGGAKQKLLSLETANEDSREGFSGAKFLSSKNRIGVDHTKELHDLLNNGGMAKRSVSTNDRKTSQGSNDDPEKYLKEIPGDDAYDSDDAMAPLREKGGSRSLRGPTRSNTVVSYYTKNQNRLRSGTLDNGYAHLQELPGNINIKDYEDNVSIANSAVEESITSDDSSSLEKTVSYNRGQGLHLANPDTNSD